MIRRIKVHFLSGFSFHFFVNQSPTSGSQKTVNNNTEFSVNFNLTFTSLTLLCTLFKVDLLPTKMTYIA